ncbi:MAG TPA: methyltransferase domain-containing protein [Methanocella sp.]|nr:methyltransferase domain-containing protein [Methanocella sp.]
MATSSSSFSYLDMLAEIGYARHIGGRKATDRLIAAAGIGKGSKVLDVGCGLGRTSCRLADEVGCDVTGVDIMPRMVEQARALAKKARVADRVRFMEGDARKLPFADGSFDVVLVESVTIFVEDVARAIAEYRRVARPGGAVCDNEVCITRKSTEELANDMADLEAIFTAFSSKTDRGILTFEDWGDLYRGQFPAVEATHYVVEPGEETMAKKEEGFGALVSMAKVAYLYYSNPEARAIIDTTRNMYKYVGHFGYGLFVCRM